MELFAWPPGFDLSSFDPFCLSIEAYLGLCEVHWVLNSVANPLISPSGELPVLKLKGEPIAGTSPIIKVLKQKGHDLDHLLSTNEMFESLAFQSMIEDTLHDALLYSWYIENVNYSNVASAVLTNTSSFLSRYTLPQKLKNRVRNRLSNTQKVRDHTGKLVPEVYVMARDCYQVLADKLGEKDFFYGTRPSTIDAIAFGHLALHALPSLAHPALFTILSFEFPTLLAFSDRMKQLAFKKSLNISPYQKPNLFDFFGRPSIAFSWLFSNIPSKTEVTERDKEERVEKFWRGLSILGGISFFAGYLINRHRIS